MNQTQSAQLDDFFRGSEIFAAGVIDTKRLLASMGISYAADGSIAFDEPIWRTVRPNGPNHKGRHVLIERSDGTVLGGMGGKFNGKHISQAHSPNSKQNSKAKAGSQTNEQPAFSFGRYADYKPKPIVVLRAKKMLERLKANPLPDRFNSTQEGIAHLRKVLPHVWLNSLKDLSPDHMWHVAKAIYTIGEEFPAVLNKLRTVGNITVAQQILDAERDHKAVLIRRELENDPVTQACIQQNAYERREMHKHEFIERKASVSEMFDTAVESNSFLLQDHDDPDNACNEFLAQQGIKISSNECFADLPIALQSKLFDSLFPAKDYYEHEIASEIEDRLSLQGLPLIACDPTEDGTLAFCVAPSHVNDMKDMLWRVWVRDNFNAGAKAAGCDVNDIYAEQVLTQYFAPLKDGATGAEAVVVHELSHLLDDMLSDMLKDAGDNTLLSLTEIDPKLNKLYQQEHAMGITYAGDSPHEFTAEKIAQYLVGRDGASNSAAQSVYTAMRERYNLALGIAQR